MSNTKTKTTKDIKEESIETEEITSKQQANDLYIVKEAIRIIVKNNVDMRVINNVASYNVYSLYEKGIVGRKPTISLDQFNLIQKAIDICLNK